MAAFVIVTSLLEIVEQQLLQPNPSLNIHHREMILFLSQKIRFLQAFLEERGKKSKERLVAGIQDVAAEAESKIESKLRQVYSSANRGECVVVASQQLHQTLLQVLTGIRQLVLQIEWQKLYASLQVDASTNGSDEDSIITIGSASRTVSEIENEIIVGLDKEEGKIVSRLIQPFSMKHEVVSLVGEGGIGKTTLAKRIFQHSDIIAHFQIHAWVVVSQEHNLKRMLVHLLRCIMPMTNEISDIDDAELAEKLRNSLMGRRYLTVLDDIWIRDAWDAIRECFPQDQNGSRIMITTRFQQVADYHPRGYVHRMRYLDAYTSWELFPRKALKERCLWTPEFARLGGYIVSLCRGLPLAIVVISGLLAAAKGSSKIWERVWETMAKSGSADDRVSKVLSLSYDYLPTHLKVCFLYFGVFPEDTDILATKIINLWVAEGFLKPEKNKSLEEVGKNCLFYLINRRLVEVNEQSVDGTIKSCKIHDRLHEVCLSEANKENIVCVVDGHHAAPDSRRWISVQSSHWPITEASYGNRAFEEIRSVLYFGIDSHLSNCRLTYPCLKLLRVLDLSSTKYWHGLPSGTADLIHLRYLALNTIGSVNKSRLFKLRNLQTLIVTSWMKKCPLQMACNISDLPKLRHLCLERSCSQYLPLSARENLQTLYWLKVDRSSKKPNFRMVPNLKELGICIEGGLLPGCLDGLAHLRLIEKLKIEVGRVEHIRLPAGIPPNLKKLTLAHTYLPWKDMDIIGKFPNLEVLKSKDFAFCGLEWRPTVGGVSETENTPHCKNRHQTLECRCSSFPTSRAPSPEILLELG